MYATISADVVSSTSLSSDSMVEYIIGLREFLSQLEMKYRGFWGRIVRGDSIECVLENPEDAFEVALILKAWTKAFEPKDKNVKKRFKTYGLRIAIGIGEMKTIKKDLDIMDGEAIYRSGRALDNLVGREKYYFTISMKDSEVEQPLGIIIALVNSLLNNTTARRCKTLYNKIMASGSKKTAEEMGITVSAVNQSLNAIGWNAIEQAIMYYRKLTRQL